MICNDDIPGDPTTTTELTIGETFSSTLVHDGCDSDVDYLKVELEYGKRYQLRGNETLSIFNRRFDVEPRILNDFPAYGSSGLFGFSSTTNTIRAIHNGTHYLRISAFTPQDYSLTLTEISSDDGIALDEFPLGYAAFDELTDTTRTVPFRFETTPGREYILNVFGSDGDGVGTLPDPSIGVADNSGNEWFNQDGGTGRNANLRFTAESIFAFASVGGEGNGTFRLNIREADTVPVGPGTTHRIGPTDRVIENISSANDIDWFRVSMEAGNWYRITTDQLDSNSRRFGVILRDPEREVRQVIRPSTEFDGTQNIATFDYFAETTGDHFLIARMTSPVQSGDYTLLAQPIAAPIQDVVQDPEVLDGGVRRFVLVAGEEIVLSELLLDARDDVSNGGELTEYEAFSSDTLYRDGVPQTDGIHRIPASEIGRWTQQHASGAGDMTTNLLIRARIGDNWTRWDSNPVFHRSLSPELISGSSWEFSQNEPIRWGHASEIPDYFDGVYTGFRDIDETTVSVGLAARNAGGLIRRDDGNAEIRIFVADGVDGYVDAYLPGPDSGGDIVLNSEFYGGDNRAFIGTIEYAELLRGFATALGLSELDTGDVRETVMADFSSDTLNGLPFTFLPHDEAALESIYGIEIFPTFTVDAVRNVSGIGQRPTAIDFHKVFDLRENGEVSPVSNNETIIGIQGAESELRQVAQVRDSGESASLFGNSTDNVLIMEATGWTSGREGDDELRGGRNANWYGYQFGDGDDLILENFAGAPLINPRDTLRFSGFDEFEITLDRLRFTRQDWLDIDRQPRSTDLGPVDLRIELLNEQGNSEGSVTIEAQGRAIRRIETIEIYDSAERTHRISLPALYSQLAPNEPTQFRLTSGSDALGSFVSPS